MYVYIKVWNGNRKTINYLWMVQFCVIIFVFFFLFFCVFTAFLNEHVIFFITRKKPTSVLKNNYKHPLMFFSKSFKNNSKSKGTVIKIIGGEGDQRMWGGQKSPG